ncbi:glycosyltransferase [Streptomyces meridianus]|uniref:Glycosyltransferase n=1 Tax=Streptomyces meridianus TaxID=2938945 RepID=A0ABT0XBW1_9ACTN|nr:glycosyltransferase [Streptomyces meridianus]MCM2579227.1 glycosyltransferase [Streptomyces meridianus]
MSVHSHSAAGRPAATTAAASSAGTPEFPRHVVTAVLVAHDGARWLSQAIAGLAGQTRPVQNFVAADTGSADESAALLAESFGPHRVLHLARRTSFGTAVDEAARTAGVLTPDDLPYLKRPSGWDPVTRTWRDEAYDMPELPHGEPVQWLWLLHDDCAPEPEALAELLRVADAAPSAAIVGPKLRSWYDRRQLLETGVSIANSGRRWTGLERREQDQGQHDQVRQVLSVSTAGMLIRRDVWEELGGFDRRLPLMRDDVDLCWRAQAAGHRALVAPEAVMRHAEASARERRPIDCVGRSVASPHRVDKAGAVYTLLVNSSGRGLPWVLLRLVLGTLLRTLAYLVGKVPGQALDEITGLLGVLLRPERILAARRMRGKPAVEHRELRPLFPPPGATVRATFEQVVGNFGGRSEPDLASGGRHGAVETGPGGDDAEFLEVEQFARLKRIARRPGPVLFLVLLFVSLIACRDLLGPGALSGGSLLPAPSDASDLWGSFTAYWHPVGIGATDSAPPYLAVFALLSTLLFGSTGLAITLFLVCSVPLAGFTAYFASRPLVESKALRAWASVAYAFLPATTGALAGGRLGTAVLAIVLPLMARTAVASAGLRLRPGQRPSWRAVWAHTVLVTFSSAFTPIVWPIALCLAAGVLLLRFLRDEKDQLPAYGLRFLSVVVTPLVVLAPWSLALLTHPGALLTEVGQTVGNGGASAFELLALSPGGPKADSGLLLIGVVLAAFAALLRGERTTAIRVAWTVALVGFLFAALSNSVAWAGPATLVYGLALICAAAVGAEGARQRVASQSFGWRQPVAGLIALAAAAAPLLTAAGWMTGGAAGPVERRDPVQVPAFVAEESRTRDQARTLVLGGSGSRVSYTLVRGSGGRLGDADIAAEAGTPPRLADIVANLVAGSGADQTSRLSGYAVRYLLVRDGAPREMTRVLDATPGLTRLSQQDGGSLYRVDQRVSRVAVVDPESARGQDSASGREPVAVAAGPVEAHTNVPSGPAGRVLRIADKADPGWQATLDGKPLKPVTVDGWAQGFELPANGGRLDLTVNTPLTHTGWLAAQGLLAAVVLVLALPGRRREIDDDLPETAADAVPAQPAEGEGRRARRLRAAAEAEQGVRPATGAARRPEEPFAAAADESGYWAEVPEHHDVPQQPAYADWNDPAYAGGGHHDAGHPQSGGYGGYPADTYPSGPADPYGPGSYGGEQQPAQTGPYGGPDGADPYTDPYGYTRPAAPGGPQGETTYGDGGVPEPRRDGSEYQ